MKSKFSQILGIGLAIVILTSMMVAAVPVAAGELAWTAATLPSATGLKIAAGSEIGFIAASADGSTLFASSGVVADIYRSTTGGLTWTASTTDIGAVATAIAVSPTFAADKTIYAATTVAGAGTLYKSTDSGANFIQIAAGIAGEVITSIAASPSHATDGLVIVGTSNAVGGLFGNVYQMGKPATFGLTPINTTAPVVLFAQDVTAVAFSPNYLSDRTILAVGSDALDTVLFANVNWEGTWGTLFGGSPVLNLATDVGSAAATAIVSSSIALPSDYNGLSLTGRFAYVATQSGLATDNVYRVNNQAVAAIGPAVELVGRLAYAGTITAGTLFGGYAAAGQVTRSSNPTATTVAWTASAQPPTGGGPTSVAVAPDFATSSKVYAGTAGAAANNESAFSVSTNSGAGFVQYGLIDTVISSVSDFVLSPAGGTDAFMVTIDTATVDSVWKSTDSAASGTNWVRTLTLATIADAGVIRVGPAYATDKTVVFGSVTGTAVSKSTDGGITWTAIISPTAVADIAVEDANNFYVASSAAARVEKNVAGVWHFSASTTPPGAVALSTITQAANGDIFAAGTTGIVWRSTDKGFNFTQVGAAIGAAIAGKVSVAVDGKYATNKIIYAGNLGTAGVDGIWDSPVGAVDDTGVKGLFSINSGTATATTAWTAVDVDSVTAGTQAPPVSGIASAADGTLYVADPRPAAAAAGGVWRLLDPTTATGAAELVGTGDGLTLTTDTLTMGLSASAGTGRNQLAAIEPTALADRVLVFTDTFIGLPTLTAPANAAKLTTVGTATITWTGLTVPTALAAAVAYAYDINTAATFAAATALFTGVGTGTATTATPAGLANATTYNWRVRATAPLFSRYSAARTFLSALPAPAAAAAAQSPAPGTIGTEALPMLNPIFTWPAVAGATYEFQIGEDPTFAILQYAATATTNTHVARETLAYTTTYYWRVRAVVGTQQSAWTAGVFTTGPKPAEATPPVVIQPQPEKEIQIERIEVPVTQPPIVVQQQIPTYLLWVIILIGAVLIIALIVLIVRTRRVA